MTLENINQIETIDQKVVHRLDTFLGEAKEHLSNEDHASLVTKFVEHEKNFSFDTKEGQEVTYDKYKKCFFVDGQSLSLGEIVASRHFGHIYTFSPSIENSGDGKKLKKILQEKIMQDFLVENTNVVLAEELSKKTQKKDALKSKAYTEITQRGLESNEQLGVFAEKMMYGVAETIALDRSDLGIKVHPANAFQDVEEKIDFIIETQHKKRGTQIGATDFTDKTIGIQFTINSSKRDFKENQIARAKEKGIEVDDIVYVEIDSSVLKNALKRWKENGQKSTGPWMYIEKNIQEKALHALFNSVLTEEQEKTLYNYNVK